MRELAPDQYADLMRFAFNQVCDPDDWKAPVDALVPACQYKTSSANLPARE